MLIALDEGWTTNREAEEHGRDALRRLGLPVLVACTHLVPGRVVVTAEVDGAADAGSPAPEVLTTVEAQRTRTGGRAFAFPGIEFLDGTLDVEELLADSAVDRVRVIGGGEVAGRRLDTQSFVRPQFEGGALVLTVRPARNGTLVPFEQPVQRPCCAAHG